MNIYRITIEVHGVIEVSSWSGYTEQNAICQAFLYYAQKGATSLSVIAIEKL
jgi:hypothetical protein